MHHTIIAFALAAVTALSGQGSAGTLAAPSSFSFKQGQRVYVTAYHKAEHSLKSKGHTVQSAGVIDPHLPAELRVRKDLERRKIYQLVDKPDVADFVLLVLIDGSAAEALALSPAVLAQYRNNLDIEALRTVAYARWTVGPLVLHSTSRLSARLVDRVHATERVANP